MTLVWPRTLASRAEITRLGQNYFTGRRVDCSACSFRLGSDAPNILRDELLLKSGEAPYVVEPDPNDDGVGFAAVGSQKLLRRPQSARHLSLIR